MTKLYPYQQWSQVLHQPHPYWKRLLRWLSLSWPSVPLKERKYTTFTIHELNNELAYNPVLPSHSLGPYLISFPPLSLNYIISCHYSDLVLVNLGHSSVHWTVSIFEMKLPVITSRSTSYKRHKLMLKGF